MIFALILISYNILREQEVISMGMTLTEKILASHTRLETVKPGQMISAKVDLVMANDATFPVSLKEYRKEEFTKVFDKQKIVLVMDHFTPNKDIKAAENCRLSREFAQEKGIEHFYDVGQMGIEHALLPEKGLVAPGELIIGGDSHTCTYGALGAFSTGVGSTDVAAGIVTGEVWLKVPSTIKFNLMGELMPWVSGKDIILYILSKIGVAGALYKSMEFDGPGLKMLSMDDRFTIANMAIEAGAKNGIFAVDNVTLDYINERVNRSYTVFSPDADAYYERVIDVNMSEITPMVALPHLPSNGLPVNEVYDIELDEVFIGSCTNGRLSDLAVAASILKGKEVSKGIRTIIIPATQAIYKEAMKLGYLETFIDAGCAISTPTCGACGGGHMGLMGKGERVLSTSNRNFVGRMGHAESEIYLSSPAVAAASAITGKITDPNNF